MKIINLHDEPKKDETIKFDLVTRDDGKNIILKANGMIILSIYENRFYDYINKLRDFGLRDAS